MNAKSTVLLISIGLSLPLAAQVCGDCDRNGAVSITDALKAAQVTTGLIVEQPGDLAVCDVDDSGAIAIIDALKIAQSAVGLAPALRCPGGPMNQPPAATSVTPVLPAADDVLVDYLIQDAESNLSSIMVSISTDGGSSFPFAATEATGGDGTSALSSSPGGVMHAFAWDSRADIGMGLFANVVVRITASDGVLGPPGDSAPFTVDNSPPPSPPEVSAVVLSGGQPASADVTIDYLLADAQADAVSITVEVSTDGGSSFPITATDAMGGDGRAGLASSPGGTAHAYSWDSLATLGATMLGNVSIRITPSDGQTGIAGQTAPFVVDNRPPNMAPSVTAVTPPMMASGDVSLTYLLQDPESDLSSITVELSTDSGISFPVTATDGVGGDGRMMLSTLPGGVTHTYVWDSVANLGTTLVSTIQIRITPMDGQAGTPGSSMTFSVDNRPPMGISYMNDLEPTILMASGMGCLPCHGGMFPSAGLNLESYAGLIAGSGGGPVIIPGDPDMSRLICRLEGAVCGSRMPRGRTPWTPAMITTFRDWVSQGAMDN